MPSKKKYAYEYPRPSLTVDLVLVTTERRPRVLLIQRKDDPFAGRWAFPGGFVNENEPLETAARRELKEETGLEVVPLSVFEIFERIITDTEGRPEYHYVLIDYQCRVIGGQLQAASDVSQAAWVPQHKLREYRLTEGTRAVIERAFAEL